MPVALDRRRFDIADFHRMIAAEILREDDRVELIEGEIVEMTPIGSRHAACVMRLTHLLGPQAGSRFVLSVQNPIQLGPRSEPQPDLVLLAPRADFYAESHPTPEDVLLLIEVMETSAGYDRSVKLPLYATFGIREVWLVDLEREVIELLRSPSAESYTERREASLGSELASLAMPDVVVAVAAALGPR